MWVPSIWGPHPVVNVGWVVLLHILLKEEEREAKLLAHIASHFLPKQNSLQQEQNQTNPKAPEELFFFLKIINYSIYIYLLEILCVRLRNMGHHSCCNQQKVKRGLWSPEEDEKLIRYINTHGYGCWSEVPEKAGHFFLSISHSHIYTHNNLTKTCTNLYRLYSRWWNILTFWSGLQRCGKSCRLRWINYLRPDIRRGRFTPEEEKLIISLHGVVGNRFIFKLTL